MIKEGAQNNLDVKEAGVGKRGKKKLKSRQALQSCQRQDFGLYPKSLGKPCKSFKQVQDMITFCFKMLW